MTLAPHAPEIGERAARRDQRRQTLIRQLTISPMGNSADYQVIGSPIWPGNLEPMLALDLLRRGNGVGTSTA
jgi:hypothetical protein